MNMKIEQWLELSDEERQRIRREELWQWTKHLVLFVTLACFGALVANVFWTRSEEVSRLAFYALLFVAAVAAFLCPRFAGISALALWLPVAYVSSMHAREEALWALTPFFAFCGITF